MAGVADPGIRSDVETPSGRLPTLPERHGCRGFVEIHSPKLIAGESESGAGVFTTDYFGETACLAQSPQLYKQLAVAGDLGGVYEVGPVFRAENSNTRKTSFVRVYGTGFRSADRVTLQRSY